MLRQRRKEGLSFEAGLDNNSVFGKNYFGQLCKKLAERCQFSDLPKQKASSKRREGTSALVNATETIDGDFIKKRTCHKSNAHENYKQFSDKQFDNTQIAFQEQKTKKPMVSL